MSDNSHDATLLIVDVVFFSLMVITIPALGQLKLHNVKHG